jgi:hypothetical protein
LQKKMGVSIKTDIEALLKELKQQGKDRRTIERELSYSDHYIDQLLSKGGNKRFYGALKHYYDMLVQQNLEGGLLEEAPTPWALSSGIPDYPDCDYSTRAQGSGMQPLILNNALVGGKRLADPSVIVFGEVYIVHIRNGIETIRYIQPAPGDPDSVLLVALQEDTAPTPLRRADILELYQGKFVVNPL